MREPSRFISFAFTTFLFFVISVRTCIICEDLLCNSVASSFAFERISPN